MGASKQAFSSNFYSGRVETDGPQLGRREAARDDPVALERAKRVR